jgi:hypothetical protein
MVLARLLPLLLCFAASAPSVAVSTGCVVSCTEVGCNNNVRATRAIVATDAQLAGATVRVCGNDGCGDITLAADAFADRIFSGSSTVTPEHHAEVRRLASGDLEIDITYGTFSPTEDADAPAPVKHTFTVTASDGSTVLLEVEGTPKYEELYPNGESCSPVCYDAEL